jgi:hypothetical protein
MDEKTLNEAVENISLIKGVIDRTSKSFTAFGKLFIYWGLLFILTSAITLLMTVNKGAVPKIVAGNPIVNFLFPMGIIALIAFAIYILVSRKLPLVGLEKQLIKVWLLVLVMNVLPPKIMIQVANGINPMGITVQTSRLSVLLFSLAIALIVTSLFTGYRQLGITGIVYIAISVLYSYTHFRVFDVTIMQILSTVAIPFTFIYTGIYLKTRQVRGS